MECGPLSNNEPNYDVREKSISKIVFKNLNWEKFNSNLHFM